MRAKLILISALLTSISIGDVHAQKLKDRLNSKLNQVKGGNQDSNELDDRSMTEIAKGWESGEYKMYRKYSGMNTWDPETEKIELRFLKDENGEVTEIRVGSEKYYKSYEPYAYGGSDFIGCYFNNALDILHLTDESVIHYNLDKEYRVAGLDWCAGKKVKYKATINEIQGLRDFREKTVTGDREAIAEAERQHRAKYTLEDKFVTDIKAVFPKGEPGHIVHGASIDIGFEITLEDGTVLKTSNIGGNAYVEDLIEKGENCYIRGLGSNYLTAAYGGNPKTKAKLIGNVHNFSKDRATVTIKSKYKGSAELKLDFILLFNDLEEFNCNGENGYPGATVGSQGGQAGHGCPVEVKIKKVKHSVTGEQIYFASITEKFSGKTSKIKFNKGLHINVRGGYGGTGSQGTDKQKNEYGVPGKGGTGGRGGNGGNIELILDPTAKDVKFTYNNSAGAGGEGGRGGTCWSCPNGNDGPRGSSGSSGTSGTFNKTISSVQF